MRKTENYKYKICEDRDNAGEVLDAYGANFTALDGKLKNLERGGGVSTPYDLRTLAQIVNRTYEGVDLTVKFAAEIAAAPYNGDEWAWIKGRIQAANYEGIWVGDYIPFSAGGYNFKAEVAGIDTYYGTDVTHHIDFISREVWPVMHVFNKVDYNNGTTVSPYPWLACDLYAWLNSLQMNVPNSATANPALVNVDYRSTGVYDKLPEKLKQVIVAKYCRTPIRYVQDSLLKDDNSGGVINIGKLWILSEFEFCGYVGLGSLQWAAMANHIGQRQYPIFEQYAKRTKRSADNPNKNTAWWLLTGSKEWFELVVNVELNGTLGVKYAKATDVYTPICFRVA